MDTRRRFEPGNGPISRCGYGNVLPPPPAAGEAATVMRFVRFLRPSRRPGKWGKGALAPHTSRLALLLAVVLLMLAAVAVAAPIENLQQTRVPVPDQSEAARADALGTALSTILVRLTGRPELADSPAVAELLAEPAGFVQRYHYEQQGEQLLLVVKFDGRALRDALVRRDIPIWQPGRPRVLTWLATESGGERQIVEADGVGTVGPAFRAAAVDLGVPVFYPLMDLQDRGRVRFTDVAGGFPGPVLAASERYGASLVLIGRLRESGGWAGRWTLHGLNGAPVSWRSAGAELQAVLDQAAERLAEALRKRYAMLPDLSPSTRFRVRITGVTDLDDFATAERLLANAPGVAVVELDRIEGDTVSFRLVLSVPPQRVVSTLNDLPALTPQPARPAPMAAPTAGAGAGASYRLTR